MGIKLITNGVWEDAVQLAVSNGTSTTYTPDDAIRVTGGGRHLRATTDVASRSIMYRNNSQKLHADCCIVGGATRAMGHNLGLYHFQNAADGAFTGSDYQTLSTWPAGAFGKAYGRDFNGTDQRATISNADQVGLDPAGDFWIAGWYNSDNPINTETMFAQWQSTGEALSYNAYRSQSGGSGFKLTIRDDPATGYFTVTETTVGAPAADTDYFYFAYFEDGVGLGISVDNNTFDTLAFTGTRRVGGGVVEMGSQQLGSSYMDGTLSRWCFGNDLTIGPAAMSSWLYQGGAGRNWQEWTPAIKENFGLVSHWSCDENSGDIIDDHGPNTLTDNNDIGVVKSNINYKSISDRFNQGVTNPEEADAAQFNTTEFAGPKDKTGKPQDLAFFFPSRAAQFVAANSEYLSRANADITGLNGGADSFTIGGFYRQDGATAVGGIVTMGTGGTTDRRYGLYNQGGTLYFEVFDTSGASVYPGVGVSQDVWYFVVCTYDSTTKLASLYVDNALVATGTSAAALNTVVTDFRLGSYLGGNYGHCTLKNWFALDSVLSADEITFLYNNGAGKDFDELLKYDGLQAKMGACSWWPLNEKGGARHDRGKWGNGLIDNNTVTYTDAPTTRDGGGLIASQEGFAAYLSAGDGGAYTEKINSLYFGESLDLGNANWPIHERPASGKITVEGRTFDVERSTSLTFENLTRDEIAAFEARNLDEPVFLYDKNAKFLHDKLWHCIIDSYNITPEFNDLNTLTISMQRLKHYEVD